MKFLKCIFLFLIFTGIYNDTCSQNKSGQVMKIKEEVEQIHLDTALKSITLQNDEFLENITDGGGELTGFYKGNKIYRIYRSIGISNGVGISEFYYKNNKLIFIREKFNSYVYDSILNTFDYTKINTKYTGKYYFNNGKLFQKYVRGYRNDPGPPSGLENILLEESNEAYNFIFNKIRSLPVNK